MSFELFKNVVAVVLQFWKSFPTLNFPHSCLVLNKQKAAKIKNKAKFYLSPVRGWWEPQLNYPGLNPI